MEETIRPKTCVVTGASSGIGFEIAKELVGTGAWVIGVGRDPARCEAAAVRIRERFAGAKIEFEIADLSSQREIRGLATRISKRLDARNARLDVLVNNAGLFTWNRRESVDGIELQFAVNYLAAYLLTLLLLPCASAGSRVILVSSASHYSGRIHWSDVNLHRLYFGLAAYGQSKLAEVLFVAELARRLGEGSGITVCAADPGLVNTEIGLKGNGPFVRWFWHLRSRKGLSPCQSAAAIVYLATSDEVERRSGLYWYLCEPRDPSRRSRDASAARRLWELSETLTGEGLR